MQISPPNADIFRQRLHAVRTEMTRQKLDALLVPLTDEYQGEYIPACARRLEWLSGFTGSAGLAVILKNKAALFVDGRYTLQAKKQVNNLLFNVHNIGELSPVEWVKTHVRAENRLGYDPWLHTVGEIKRISDAGMQAVALKANIIDGLWRTRPDEPMGKVEIHPLKYAGETAEKKKKPIISLLKRKKMDAALLTMPESIMWLLNIRGSDVPMTPFALCYALIEKNENIRLYIEPSKITPAVKKHLGNKVLIRTRNQMKADIQERNKKDFAVLVDKSTAPIWFVHALSKANIVWEADVCSLAKACKNTVEREGMRNAHRRDGLAESRFLSWLNNQTNKPNLTEMDIADKLESFRAQATEYRGPSFHTIAGAGANGAIVHYRATGKTNSRLVNNNLLLIDSGGQYPDGTTDVTRTIAIGTPSKEMRQNFTRVLKGHIALALALFPQGTTGSQLDVLARRPLWDVGLDYDHGTGHGVGSYLSVHEGPQRISKRGNDIALKPGMILSNEPGYYKEGGYGIRIENLVMVVEKSGISKQTYGFETLTLVPIDRNCIIPHLLTEQEKDWLNEYHTRVYNAHQMHIDSEEKKWLKWACAPL